VTGIAYATSVLAAHEIKEGRSVSAQLPRENMVTYTLANGGVATLRASGTEPKIKYHLRVIGIRAGSLN
jgi:phosphomannomutase